MISSPKELVDAGGLDYSPRVPTTDRSRALASPWIRVWLLLGLAGLGACDATRSQLEGNEHARTVAPLVAAAERALARSDYNTAIASYREAYGLTPWNSRIQRALAAAYAERAGAARHRGGLGSLRAAERDLREALALLPDELTLQRNLALILVEQAARELDPTRSGALREEARGLAPDVVEAAPLVELRVERRLDLAFDLARQGKLEAAIEELERIHLERPQHVGATRLLAQTLVRQGTELAQRSQHGAAAAHFDRAVASYASLENCAGAECDPKELALAHQNRITAWLSADRPNQARRALAEAVDLGLRFPGLARALAEN